MSHLATMSLYRLVKVLYTLILASVSFEINVSAFGYKFCEQSWKSRVAIVFSVSFNVAYNQG